MRKFLVRRRAAAGAGIDDIDHHCRDRGRLSRPSPPLPRSPPWRWRRGNYWRASWSAPCRACGRSRTPCRKRDSASFTTSMSACGPDTMTASVPLLAPPTPPLTGESICTMFFLASSAQISAATREPVVERSTKRLIFLPWMTPPSPSRDLLARFAATAGSPSPSRPGRQRRRRRAQAARPAPPAAPPRRCACRRRRACGRPRSAGAPSAAPILPSPIKPMSMCGFRPSIFFRGATLPDDRRRRHPGRTAIRLSAKGLIAIYYKLAYYKPASGERSHAALPPSNEKSPLQSWT